MPTRERNVSDLNQAIYNRLVELGHIDADGKVHATNAANAIFGDKSKRQVVDGWVNAGRDPQLDGDTQRLLVEFLRVSPLEVLRLAGFFTDDDYGDAEGRRPYLSAVA